MVQSVTLTAVCLVIALVGCGSNDRAGSSSSSDNGAVTQSISHDLTTPEGAILSLEDAYRAQDIEAAVRCKDFNIEAKLMLQKLQQDLSNDAEILSKTVEVLELGFRTELKNTGFPDFRNIVSTFSEKRPYQGRDDIVQLAEHCRHSDGTTTTNMMVVAKAADGWKVVTVPD